MAIGLPIVAALVALLLVLALSYLAFKHIQGRRAQGKISAKNVNRTDAKWAPLEGQVPDDGKAGKDQSAEDGNGSDYAGDAEEALLGKQGLPPAAQEPAGQGDGQPRKDMAQTAAELRSMIEKDLDKGSNGETSSNAQALADSHQDRLHHMTPQPMQVAATPQLQPIGPAAAYQAQLLQLNQQRLPSQQPPQLQSRRPLALHPLLGAPAPAKAPADPETAAAVADVMSSMVDKVVNHEQARLAELETSFEGSIEALMRAREAKHRQQLEDLSRIKERFLSRTKEIYGGDLSLLDQVPASPAYHARLIGQPSGCADDTALAGQAQILGCRIGTAAKQPQPAEGRAGRTWAGWRPWRRRPRVGSF